MGAMLVKILKKLLGYLGAKLLKPETVVELILDLAETHAKRTKGTSDDEVIASIRKALELKD